MVDASERLGFDSIWLSERIGTESPDPVVGLAVAAGRTARLKLGMSVMVLPGRNPVVVAKQLATLDVLSSGRLLPAFGLGIVDANEQQAFGVGRADRAPWLDEALPLLRRMWSEDRVDHEGQRFRFESLVVEPKPHNRSLDVWLGGRAPSELRRVGRLADGWLASFVTPQDARRQRQAVEASASDSGRQIDPEHFGVVLPYLPSGVAAPDALVALVRRRSDAPVEDVCPSGGPALQRHLERFVDAGFSKFVLVPAARRAPWDEELETLANVALVYQRDSRDPNAAIALD